MFKNNDGLYTVEMKYRWNSVGSLEHTDYINRFRFDVKRVNSYWVPINEYIFIPTMLEEIYQRLHPCYKIEYLKNGNEKRRISYYGN